MTHTIVCFGNSNTHGANPDPSIGGRHPRDVRWPGVMRAALGVDYEVIEEGLNGRCTVWDAPSSPGRCGSLPGALPALASAGRPRHHHARHQRREAHLRQTASEIALRGRGPLWTWPRGPSADPVTCRRACCWWRPVPVGEATAHSEMWGLVRPREESRRLAGMYQLIANGRGVGFFDAGSVAQVSPLDGVHLDTDGHAALGAAMAVAVRAELARG